MEAEKQQMRATLRRMRGRLAQGEVQRLSTEICRRAQKLPHFQAAASVGLYLSADNEVDPSSLLLAATASEKAVFLPVVDRHQRTMCLARYRAGDPLVTGAFGIREPLLPTESSACIAAGSPRIAALDVLFLPLVAFDPQGWRLGYGGGYYDRFLRHKQGGRVERPVLVGLAYHFQEVPVLPHAPHDIPMDWVITDQAVCSCTGMTAQNHT